MQWTCKEETEWTRTEHKAFAKSEGMNESQREMQWTARDWQKNAVEKRYLGKTRNSKKECNSEHNGKSPSPPRKRISLVHEKKPLPSPNPNSLSRPKPKTKQNESTHRHLRLNNSIYPTDLVRQPSGALEEERVVHVAGHAGFVRRIRQGFVHGERGFGGGRRFGRGLVVVILGKTTVGENKMRDKVFAAKRQWSKMKRRR
ncbi:hypothetical protein C8J56DRAFT_900561 [Mycena floridula]|nr:hypothetical protein C8J56DRAFT_900561 [Mycena floridula]